MEIRGFKNYLIFSTGEVYSKKTNKFIKERVKVYKRVNLISDDNKTKTMYIHRLLAEHYIPNPCNYPVVDHIDRNPLNNDLTNLRWTSYAGNSRNCSQTKDTSKSGITGIELTPQKTYRAFITESITMDTLEEAIATRDCVYENIFYRKPKNKLTAIKKTRYGKFVICVKDSKCFKTLDGALKYRENMVNKYYFKLQS